MMCVMMQGIQLDDDADGAARALHAYNIAITRGGSRCRAYEVFAMR
jgi:hypothetical protein